MSGFTNNLNYYSNFKFPQGVKGFSAKQNNQVNKTLKGVLVNTYIKDKETKKTEMDEICNNLIIPDSIENYTRPNFEKPDIPKKGSLLRNSLPYIAGALLATGMTLAVSNSYLKSQKLLKPGNVPAGVKLPSVGKNINLHSEEYFAIYMAISEPKSRNIFALLGVLAMSALTCIGKNLVDGVKKVWLKKQEADIKKNFEEQMIETETRSFAGKLDVVREELVEKSIYFKEKLANLPSSGSLSEKPQTENKNSLKKVFTPLFGKYLAFSGSVPINNTDNNDKNLSFKDSFKKIYDKANNSPIFLGAVTALTLGLMFLGGKKVYKNMAKGAKIKENAISLNKEKIKASINDITGKIKASNDETEKNKLLDELKEKLLSLGAGKDEISDVFSKTGINSQRNKELTEEVSGAINNMKFGDKFYVQADPAMGGKEGTQFYIYIDEAKGYIYDVITHPENKFARYLFSAIAATGACGYGMKEAVDAVKEVAIMKENSYTELDLQNRLVETEIRNFKSKKQSAIEPLMVEFDTKLNEGKSKEELKVMAENILLEIKNGPPFVYV